MIWELSVDSHAYVDRLSIIGQCVVVEGWANDFDPMLLYDEIVLEFTFRQVERPELVDVFGDDARHWGFVLCAVLPSTNFERQKFVIRFNDNITMANVHDVFSAPDDVDFSSMVAEFKNDVEVRRGRMLEIGARARSGSTYRGWFPDDIEYLGLDVLDGPNVDIVGDAHHMSEFIEQKFTHMFSMAVFEHILMPWKVAIEMSKCMDLGGTALIISHNAWPLHEEPWDFFRFSRESWNGVFNAHTGFKVRRAEYQYPASVVPRYTQGDDMQVMSQGRVFLLSGCLIEKISEPLVAWSGRAEDVYNMGYSHA